MPAVVDKPRIQCRYRDDQNRQRPVGVFKNSAYGRFRLP